MIGCLVQSRFYAENLVERALLSPEQAYDVGLIHADFRVFDLVNTLSLRLDYPSHVQSLLRVSMLYRAIKRARFTKKQSATQFHTLLQLHG